MIGLPYQGVKKVLSLVGLEIGPKEGLPRLSFGGALRHARDLGVAPKTVIDIGAAYGDWSMACYQIFPNVQYLLVEPLEEFADFLTARMKELSKATYIRAAVAKSTGVLTIHVHPDLVGSSLLLETEGQGVDGVEREVLGTTVDELVRSHDAPRPYLLKVDVQGAELDVLTGATETLRSTDFAILEVSFFQFFLDGPQFHDVIMFMHESGFVVYDIFNLLYRPLDGALAQADIIFVPKGSPLRWQHAYATLEQRKAQNRFFREQYVRRHKAIRRTLPGS